MKDLSELNTLDIDFSKIAPIENVSENILLSEELLEKYKIEIDESKIEKLSPKFQKNTDKHCPLRIKLNTSEKFLPMMFQLLSKTCLMMCYAL